MSIQPARPPIEIDPVVEDLFASYRLGFANRFGRNAPNKSLAIHLFELVQEILFPGFYEKEHHAEIDRPFILRKITRAAQALRSLIRDAAADSSPAPEAASAAAFPWEEPVHPAVPDLIGNLLAIRSLLVEDARFLLKEDPAATCLEEILLCYPGFQAMTAYRVSRFLHAAGVQIIPRIIMEHIHGQTGIDIHPAARIACPVFIDHGTGIVIGETAVIGERVKIYHGVTLGAFSVSKRDASTKRHPTVLDGAVLYSGATILGGETVVGRDAVIGANVWVTHSVPDGAKVLR